PPGRRPRPAGLIGLSMLLMGPAASAGGTPLDLTELPMEQLLDIDVVYGASRYEQRVTEAPSSITLVTGDEIRRFGYETLAEALAGVRGFYTTYDRAYTYVGVRGFSRPSDYNSRTLLLVDGHRINENLFGSAYVGTEQVLDMDLIDRIEIIRGPGSSLYGAGGFFAVVNVVTRRAGAMPGVQVAALGASHRTRAGRAAWSRVFGGAAEVTMSASGFKSAGQDFNFPELDDMGTPADEGRVTGVDDDDFRRGFARLRLRNLTLTGAYNWRQKDLAAAPYQATPGSGRNTTADARAYFDLRYERQAGSRVSLLARAYYDNYWYTGVYDYGADYRERYTSYWVGGELQGSFKPSERQILTVGAEFRDHPKQARRVLDYAGPFRTYTRLDGDDFALYVQDEIRLGRTTTVHAGVRYDHYSSFGGSTNPRVALLFHPSPRTVWKAIYGEAFRAPNVAEEVLGAAANPFLDPEKIVEESLILERYCGRNLRVSGTLFRTTIDGLIDDDGSLGALENLGAIRTRGAEVEIEQRWNRGRRLQFSYAFQDTHDAGDDHLTNSPAHLAKLHLELPLAGERLDLGAEILYTSDRILRTRAETGGFVLANLTLLARRLARGLDLSATVLNLFDTGYADPAAEFHTQEEIPQNGRTYRLRMVWSF
ncbi:MAG: TonB-dependent receptor plug domain-containing protein, partial [Candidatus Polarisedimenticolia bacterium]